MKKMKQGDILQRADKPGLWMVIDINAETSMAEVVKLSWFDAKIVRACYALDRMLRKISAWRKSYR